jgi:hypothetical protein
MDKVRKPSGSEGIICWITWGWLRSKTLDRIWYLNVSRLIKLFYYLQSVTPQNLSAMSYTIDKYNSKLWPLHNLQDTSQDTGGSWSTGHLTCLRKSTPCKRCTWQYHPLILVTTLISSFYLPYCAGLRSLVCSLVAHRKQSSRPGLVTSVLMFYQVHSSRWWCDGTGCSLRLTSLWCCWLGPCRKLMKVWECYCENMWLIRWARWYCGLL